LFLCGNRKALPTLFQHGVGLLRGKIAMNKLGSLPVKTRVPLAAWVFAGFLTLLSIVSSLLHVVADPGRDLAASVSEQARETRHASVTW
jgi:hypothetical protein